MHQERFSGREFARSDVERPNKRLRDRERADRRLVSSGSHEIIDHNGSRWADGLIAIEVCENNGGVQDDGGRGRNRSLERRPTHPLAPGLPLGLEVGISVFAP